MDIAPAPVLAGFRGLHDGVSRLVEVGGGVLAGGGVAAGDVAAHEALAQRDGVQALVDAGTVNDKLARQVIDGVLAGEGEPAEVVERRGLVIVSDEGALSVAVDEVIAANPDVADKIRSGKVQAAGALIGQVMKAMKGQADAGKVRELVLSKLA